MFQYRPVQLSYPKLENEVNILDIKDYLYLLVFWLKVKPRRLQRLEMNKTTIRNSEDKMGRGSLISRFMFIGMETRDSSI